MKQEHAAFKMPLLNDVLGAFADGAVLFPLLVLLAATTDLSAGMLLLSAGVAYWSAGLLFRVPMSVQPLKSIAVAAIAVGASSEEIRLSALLLGLVCLLLVRLDVESIAARVPVAVIHAVQLGLAALLVLQGAKAAGLRIDIALAAAGAAIMVGLRHVRGVPLLGLVATGGLVWAILNSPGETQSGVAHVKTMRLELVLSLLLPQLALTLTNSVLGTHEVARTYFHERANRVTHRRLLRSIGWGNVMSSLVGGLPFCHGAGGITAHVRGGATHWRMNAITGSVLILLAGVVWHWPHVLSAYPPVLVASLLIATGVFHASLVEGTWRKSTHGKGKLVLALVLAVATRNLLIVLAGAALIELLQSYASAKRQREVL